MIEIILGIVQISLLGYIVYLNVKPNKSIENELPKVDKYEDYRDPSTGRLRGKKVGL
jgi:hypothetical protein